MLYVVPTEETPNTALSIAGLPPVLTGMGIALAVGLMSFFGQLQTTGSEGTSHDATLCVLQPLETKRDAYNP